MSYSVAEIRAWKPPTMVSGGHDATSAATGLENAVDLLKRSSWDLLSQWESRTAQPTADAHYAEKLRIGREAVDEIRSDISSIVSGGEDLIHAREQVLQVVKQAESAGFNVDEATGQVTPKRPLPVHEGVVSPTQVAMAKFKQALAAASFENAIEQACRQFEQTDQQVASRLDSAPDVVSPQGQAIISAVDSGAPIPNYLAALEMPSSVYTKAGQKRLADWAQKRKNQYLLQRWLADGRQLNLPPTPDGRGYNINVQVINDPVHGVKLSYAILAPAGAGIAALTFNRFRAKPSLSGNIESPDGQTSSGISADENGFSCAADVTEPGSNNLGFSFEPEDGGLWMTGSHTTNAGANNDTQITTTLEYRPEVHGNNDNHQGQPAHVSEPWWVSDSKHVLHATKDVYHWGQKAALYTTAAFVHEVATAPQRWENEWEGLKFWVHEHAHWPGQYHPPAGGGSDPYGWPNPEWWIEN